MIAGKLYQKPVCKRILASLLLLAISPAFGWAFKIGPDVEKPKPEFTRSGEQITAKLIPRAKSTSVEIRFQVKGGKLVGVSAYDWEQAERPEVDVKNFKSSLFEIQIDNVPPGGEASVSIISDFFISSTRFFVFNPSLPSPWIMDAPVKNISLGNRVQELTVPVKDGGPLDADGAVNGRITVIGGPRDSFWGYALGTLFIRFFGIFIVLTVLMIGMLVSGKVFQRILSKDKKSAAALGDTTAPAGTGTAESAATAAPRADTADQPSVETVLAISTALHLHFESLQPAQRVCIFAPEACAWTQQGRQRMMNARNLTLSKSRS
jgi:hypothetical protein